MYKRQAYIFVIFMGIPATFLYNLLAAVIRSLGDLSLIHISPWSLVGAAISRPAVVLQGFSPEGDHGGRNPSVTADAVPPPFDKGGCWTGIRMRGVPLAGTALLGMTETGLLTR